jgi:uncharacterized protein (TIRG00374 family)
MSEKSHARNSKLKAISSIVLTVILLALVFASVSFPELVDAFQLLDVNLLIAAYVLNLVMVGLMAYRWHMLHTNDPEDRPTYLELLRVTFMGMFFNNFLPSTIGGDSYRAIHMSRQKPATRLADTLATVFVDRMVGLLGIVLIGLSALIFAPDDVQLPPGISIGGGLFFVAFSLVLFLSINARFHIVLLRVVSWLPKAIHQRLQTGLTRLFTQLEHYSEQRFLLFNALIISCFLRLVWILSGYLVGEALHLELPFYVYVVSIPLIELIRMIPITLQGIGVREGLFVLFFGYYGVSSASATLLAILIYSLLNLNGVIGGVLFLVHRRR